MIKAILRTWDFRTATYTDKIVEIRENHVFTNGPYEDTVPFAVGSNQEILPLDGEIYLN